MLSHLTRLGGAFANAAIQYASAGDDDHAIEFLNKAVDAGYRDKEGLLKEPALTKLRDDARFKQIAAR